MENNELYIKYLTHQPVPVDTSYGRGSQGTKPLITVAHLIAAFFPKTPPNELAQYTLHSINNKVETSYNSWDPLTILGENGKLGTNPLIIKSLNDSQKEMKVDSSPTTSGSSVTHSDTIDIHTEHLKRHELVEKLTALVSDYMFVRLTAPAASGKSSLLKLYEHSLKEANVVSIYCLTKKTGTELLQEQGIDLEKRKVREEFRKKFTVVFIDDAQTLFHDVDFWATLIKFAPNWLPSKIRFIISSTHLLPGEGRSPWAFAALPKLERSDFLLDPKESIEFLEMPVIGLPSGMQSETLKHVITRECGGLIGALRQSVVAIKGRFANGSLPSEKDLLEYFLSNDPLNLMIRCFGNTHSTPIGTNLIQFLKNMMVDKKVFLNSFGNQQDLDSYSSLKKAGILVDFPDTTVRFSSELAKRYCFNWIFPNRSRTTPSSLPELIKNVIGNMSATILRNSTAPEDFPKEAVFQHLFMEGLASLTPPNCSICPELSKIFPDVTNLNGEIDFYLNSNLRWGIELLVNGDRIREHISRFTPPNGKYVALAVSDYMVVDFRRNSSGQPTNISRNPKLITVFFKQNDYSIAHCLFGEDNTPVVIILSN